MSVFGVWMWPESLMNGETERTLGRCRRAGVTDIWFLTKGLAGTAACRSAVVPCAEGGDLLGDLLEGAHALGIRVHAWLTSASDETYKARHPESGRCHYTRGRDKGLISLRDPGYLDYMRRFVRELCGQYDLDGLHLDYIRYNHLMYGWDEADRARYAAAGADLRRLDALMERTFLRGERNEENCIFDALRAGDESVRALAAVRREDVRAFARALTEEARAVRPGLTLSAALMPEGAYDDTAFADLHYGQSYEDAAALYDCALPMAYSRAYDRDGAWVRMVAEGTLRRGLRTVVGLHAYDGGTGETLRADMAALRGTAIEGVCLFRWGSFVMAEPEERAVTLYHPLRQPLTEIVSGGVRIPLSPPMAAGEERRIALPGAPAGLRGFAGTEEVSLFTA